MDLDALTLDAIDSLSMDEIDAAVELRGEDGKLVYHQMSKIGKALRAKQSAADEALEEAFSDEAPVFAAEPPEHAPRPAGDWPTTGEVFLQILVQYSVSGVRGKSIKMLHDHAREAALVYKTVRDTAWAECGDDEIPPHWTELCRKYGLDPESGERIASVPEGVGEVAFAEDVRPAVPGGDEPRPAVDVNKGVRALGYDKPPKGLAVG